MRLRGCVRQTTWCLDSATRSYIVLISVVVTLERVAAGIRAVVVVFDIVFDIIVPHPAEEIEDCVGHDD